MDERELDFAESWFRCIARRSPNKEGILGWSRDLVSEIRRLRALVAEVELERDAAREYATSVDRLNQSGRAEPEAKEEELRAIITARVYELDRANERVAELEAHPRCEVCGSDGLVCPVCDESRIL